ncbi:hypothetical protein GCM10009868_40570 [Terrabacter aerolatus]|uniref:Uncharacterized protein n=1 Tax=Terrabacter aerolatus TaxID=422442 RepID=A0A512D6X5_9MICO|nr:hypothetical protein TAE01_38000 [Terrabacter aerolatus]
MTCPLANPSLLKDAAPAVSLTVTGPLDRSRVVSWRGCHEISALAPTLSRKPDPMGAQRPRRARGSTRHTTGWDGGGVEAPAPALDPSVTATTVW